MNHAYRLVWSDIAQAYIPVPESARARGKRKAIDIGAAALALLGLAGPAFALAPDALPTGGQVVGGQATISQAGSAMTVQQTSSRAAIDWQSFNIGANASVTFQQPSASAIALNRVVGQDPSRILGSLSANGQVFIVNPAGVLFGRGAQVNAQGLLASTRDISVAGFMDGKDAFSGAGAGAGQVVNEGTLRAGPGGYVALIGAQVKNLGEIHAPRGEVRLAAADRVTVTLDNGSLAGFTVERGTLDALAENGGLIKAEGGRVYLTADAADRLAKAVVNHTGVIEARGVENRDGTIVLLADLNVGTANVAGTLDASRLDGSKGGFIETSGHVVNIADGAKVKAGRWLIDPADFTIAASGGNMTGAAVSTALASGDLEIQSSTGSGGGNGDIHVNDAVAWNANTLTLTAARDININAVMTASGSSALVMNTGTANGADAGVAGGTVKVGFNADGSFKGRVDFPGRTGTGFLAINGEGYTVIDSLGANGSTTGTDLQGMQGNLNGRYALGGDIDASSTATWESGAGFSPVPSFSGTFEGLGHTISDLTINRPTASWVGLFADTNYGAAVSNVGLAGGSVSGYFTVGSLVGLNLGKIINSYTTASVSGNGGLVGGLTGDNGGSINDSHTTGSVFADSASNIGGLVGRNTGTISQSHAAATVSQSGTLPHYGGGLAGFNSGTISDSHATGNVSSTGRTVGGLAGYNSGSITRSYATGNVSAADWYAGGLVGANYNSTVSSSYATGSVSGTRYVGGLVGYLSNGSITGSYATGSATGSDYGVGGLVGRDFYGTINDSYATGSVTGNSEIGGLLGYSYSSTVNRSYATGSVTVNGGGSVGGLVGSLIGSTVNASFWNTETTGQSSSAGGTGKTTAEMQQLSTYTAAGWDIDAAGGTGKTWRIYDGQTAPLLRSFLTPLTLTATYDGSGGSYSNIAAYSGSADTSRLIGANAGLTLASTATAGTMTATLGGYASTQQGYDISYGSRTITGTGSAANELLIGSAFSWSAGTLTLNATGDIHLGAVLTATGTSKLAINSTSGTVKADFATNGTFRGRVDFPGRSGTGFLTINGEGYTVINSLGAEGSTTGTDLQGMQGNLNGRYALGGDIDATATSTWNSGQGLYSLGGMTAFTGVFDGLGHTIANLTVNRPNYSWTGLFGRIQNANIRNVGVSGGAVTGYQTAGGLVGLSTASTISNSYANVNVLVSSSEAGGLVGYNDHSTISGSYATGNVTNTTNNGAGGHSGGLVGHNSYGTISGSYATGNVSSGGGVCIGGLAGDNYNGTIHGSYATGSATGAAYTGGLVGYNSGLISNAYATGSATSNLYFVGGLVGYQFNGSIIKAFATGSVTGSNGGGLVGENGNGSVSASFWNTQTTGRSTSSGGGTGKTTAEMQQLSIYTNAGWNIDNAGGTGQTWRIYEGQTTPLLRSFLTPLTVTAVSGSRIYDGTTGGLGVSYSTTPDGNLLGSASTTTSGKNVGSYSVTPSGLYSNQRGYDIAYGSGTVDITPRALTVSGITAADKVYDGTTSAAVSTSAAVLGGLVAGDDLTVISFGAFADKNAGTGKTVNLINGYSGMDLGNYVIADQSTATASITPKALTVSGITAADKIYDGTAAATVSTAGATFSGLIAGDNLTTTGAFADKNVGSSKTVNLTYGGTDAGNYAITGQTTTASITPKALTVSGIAAADKVYDGTTSAAVSASTAVLGGLVAGDDLTVISFGAFADKNAGTGKTVNLTNGYSGMDLGNYVITDQSTATANITPRALTVSGITASDKVYDGTAAATVSTAGATFSGLIAGDSLTVNATGTFSDKNAGTAKTVSLASTYGGTDVGNYAITDQSIATASITPKALTVSGLTAGDKVYDGTTAATVSTAGATFGGLIAGDDLTVSATGAFSDKNAGTGKTVSLASTYGGADAGNYAITDQSTATAGITPKALTVSGLTAADKVYDGNTAATVSTAGATLGGLVAGDDFTVAASGSFADKNAGTGKTVTLASTYGGADAGNYAITGQANTTASITPKILTVSGLTAGDKVYDGTTAAAVSTAGATFGGLVAGDDLTVTATGSFADKNAGTGKIVNLGSSYSGNDVGNYAITDQATASASITPRTLTVSFTGQDKVYDGSTAATVRASDDRVANDTLTVARTASFADGNAGTGKSISVTGVALTGSDAGNYTLVTTSLATTADITPRPITVDLTGNVGKTADGNTNATLGSGNFTVGNLVAGEALTVGRTTGSYDSPAPGTGRAVTALLSAGDYTAGAGTLLSNYQLVTGRVSGAVGEIKAAPMTGNPAYIGALASSSPNGAATTPGASNDRPFPLAPAPVPPRSENAVPPIPGAALVSLVVDAGGQPLVSMRVIDGGLRLPEALTAGLAQLEEAR